jgi:hypothetical protein
MIVPGWWGAVTLLMFMLWQLWTESWEGTGDLYGRSDNDFAAGSTTHYREGYVSASGIHVVVAFFLA